MQNKYKGILLFTKIHKENDLFIKFLSNTDEIITGIVYGGLSKKKRNILQIGFYLNFEVYSKNNRPSSINAELSQPYFSNIINNKYKLNCLICVTTLINLSIIEGQKINYIYTTLDNFLIKMYSNKKWFKEYCIFLFSLLKIIGYEIDYLTFKNYKYFDLEKLEFSKHKSNQTVLFPHKLLSTDNIKIDIDQVIEIFNIFEKVFINHHLSNFNLSLPNHYHLFKKLIKNKLLI